MVSDRLARLRRRQQQQVAEHGGGRRSRRGWLASSSYFGCGSAAPCPSEGSPLTRKRQVSPTTRHHSEPDITGAQDDAFTCHRALPVFG